MSDGAAGIYGRPRAGEVTFCFRIFAASLSLFFSPPPQLRGLTQEPAHSLGHRWRPPSCFHTHTYTHSRLQKCDSSARRLSAVAAEAPLLRRPALEQAAFQCILGLQCGSTLLSLLLPPGAGGRRSCLSEVGGVMCGQPLIKLSEDCVWTKTLSAQMNINISPCLWIVFRVALCFSTLIYGQHD